jgi:hypothetical protein
MGQISLLVWIQLLITSEISIRGSSATGHHHSASPMSQLPNRWRIR